MPHKYCFFDKLPAEFLHIIFNYFLAHEILFSFSNVSDKLDTFLLAYSSYRVNFKSIFKENFELICDRIQPDQILCLTLSDDDDTPGQSELFFSRFHIEQFIRLQSLRLFNIEIDSLELIFSNLNKLNQLRSLSFHSKYIKYKYPAWIHDYSPMIDRLNQLLPETYSQIFPRLNRLNFSKWITVTRVPFQHLHCLILEESTINEMKLIFSQTPQLRSLNVCLKDDISNFEYLRLPAQLNRLTLTINHSSISMDAMERFLLNIFYLTHLTLNTKGSTDLVDGQRWERLSANFVKFNFRFQVNVVVNIEEMLDSFRTMFWLEEKRWYVAYVDGYLFSIPKFAPTDVPNSYNPQHFTVPDERLLYKNIIKLKVATSSATQLNEYCFNCVEILDMQFYSLVNLFSIFASFLNANSIQPRNTHWENTTRLILFYLNRMPRCHTLILDICLTEELINQLSGNQCEQIRTLIVHSSIQLNRNAIEEIIRLFPRVERLYISSITNADMIRLIDGFKYLSNASFKIESKFIESERDWFDNPELSIRRVRRLKDHAVTCRFQRSSTDNSFYFVHAWINRKIQQPFWIAHWPPRCGYIWYRLMRIISRHPRLTFLDKVSLVYFFCTIGEEPLILILGNKPLYMYIVAGIFIYPILYIISITVLIRFPGYGQYYFAFHLAKFLILFLTRFFGTSIG